MKKLLAVVVLGSFVLVGCDKPASSGGPKSKVVGKIEAEKAKDESAAKGIETMKAKDEEAAKKAAAAKAGDAKADPKDKK